MTDILAIIWNANPELFHIGGFAVRWYSLLFVSGFILGFFIFQWFFKREKLDPGLLDSLLVTLIVGTIVGARLGHCLFYQPDYYLGSWEGFLEIFMPWKGGLASHGGTIALFIAMWWFAHKYGKRQGFDFVWLVDHLSIAVCFAATFIRLGNLFNSEIYGGVTNLPWGFVFVRNEETEPHHPTQLYEALSYLILGLVLLAIYKYRFKNDQVDFEAGMALNMGQILSIPFVLLGIGFLVYAYKKKLPALVDGGFQKLETKKRK